MSKSSDYDKSIIDIAAFAKALAHPARIKILQFLAESESCITGDISDMLPLSRTTVYQHLKELKNLKIIQGEIDGLKVNYCINKEVLELYLKDFDEFFTNVLSSSANCVINDNCNAN